MDGFSDDFVYFVVTEMLDKKQVTKIAEDLITRFPQEITKIWGKENHSAAKIRTKVYDVFREGIERGFVRLNPQLAQEIAESIGQKFDIDLQRRRINVVKKRHDETWRQVLLNVTEAAADLVVELIIDIGKRRKGRPVAIGFGAGHTTMRVASRLGQVLSAHNDCPPLNLHAITSGFSKDPRPAPTTFFRFFDKAVTKIENVPLFSAPTVNCEDYEEVKKQPVVRDAFKRAHEVDVVITSLADRYDGDGLLNQILDDETRKALEDEGWVGDVQFLPYSETKPIQRTTGIRAVTLFELYDLLALSAQDNKYVVLVAGPCNICGRLKTNALRPLLGNSSLRMWSHLVTDLDTARAVLEEPQ